MNWKTKAQLQRLLSRLPAGNSIYGTLQQVRGALRQDITDRIKFNKNALIDLSKHGLNCRDASIVEIGTGHVPLGPLLFSLCGPKEIVTIDLNRRLNTRATRGAVLEILQNSEFLMRAFADVADSTIVANRLEILRKYRTRVFELLAALNIKYLSPVDASHTNLPEGQFDLHFSRFVLEHIEPESLEAVIKEGLRLLKPDGLLLHYVDCSDHFSHSDSSISSVNFLRFSEQEWTYWAGNRFAYCNRLRPPDYARVISNAGARIIESSSIADPSGLRALQEGFPLDSHFCKYTPDDLAASCLTLICSGGSGA